MFIGVAFILWEDYPFTLPVILFIFILIDEKVKEGYFFKPSDVGHRLTHETLSILAFIFGVVAYVIREYLKDRAERKRGGYDD